MLEVIADEQIRTKKGIFVDILVIEKQNYNIFYVI